MGTNFKDQKDNKQRREGLQVIPIIQKILTATFIVMAIMSMTSIPVEAKSNIAGAKRITEKKIFSCRAPQNGTQTTTLHLILEKFEIPQSWDDAGWAYEIETLVEFKVYSDEKSKNVICKDSACWGERDYPIPNIHVGYWLHYNLNFELIIKNVPINGRVEFEINMSEIDDSLEHISFMRDDHSGEYLGPDSTIFGKNVYQVRKAHGKRLAREAPVDADLVMPFPDSGTYAALGYSEESGIPFQMAMIRNHYVGRTFIQPTQDMRDFGVRVKLNPVKELLKGKDIIIIEDSIIRGTTVKTRLKALREIGVKRIHLRVSGPPHRFPCQYGIDFSTKGELIASKMSVAELCNFLSLDSLNYLSIEGLLQATGIEKPENSFCKACFDGCYPVKFDQSLTKNCLETV